MLNHIEIQGRVEKVNCMTQNGKAEYRFTLVHQRGFDPNEKDRFKCVWNGYDFGPENSGRTAIITGRLRATEQGTEIVCHTVDFVDGGGKDG